MSEMSHHDNRRSDETTHGEAHGQSHEGHGQSHEGHGQSHGKGMYLRFAAMILTGMVVMYFVMFVGSWEWSHIRFSQSRVFMAITRSERAGIEDVRVCELAVEISEAQRREIFEMDWLIEDIERNGVAATAEEAQARPVPEYEEPAERDCAG